MTSARAGKLARRYGLRAKGRSATAAIREAVEHARSAGRCALSGQTDYGALWARINKVPAVLQNADGCGISGRTL